jgi:hypothetical protein
MESTYRKFFYKIRDAEILHIAFTNFINKLQIDHSLSFIDSTTIINKLCNGESISYGFSNMKHKGIKITTLVNSNQVPLSFSISKSNLHDTKLINGALDNCNKLPKKIVGDKGYLSKDLKKYLFSKGIDLIYPYKKYKKIKKKSKDDNNKFKKNKYLTNSDEELKLLKERHKVENFFATLKQYRRLNYIYEKDIRNFKVFVEFAFCMILLNKCI